MTPIVFDYDALHDELAKLERRRTFKVDQAKFDELLDEMFMPPAAVHVETRTWLYEDTLALARKWVSDSGDCNE